jgi:Protein of unknown function (DUF3455)
MKIHSLALPIALLTAVTGLLSSTLLPSTASLAYEQPATDASTPAIPDALNVPDGQTLVMKATAIGTQIYTCTQSSDAAGEWKWTLKEPAALLTDEAGKVIGYHSKGPSWKLNDGSQITGELKQKVDSPDGAIPWLLLQVKSHQGSGALDQVNWIQRLNTVDGKAPASCDPAYEHATLSVPYSATYYFWAAQ